MESKSIRLFDYYLLDWLFSRLEYGSLLYDARVRFSAIEHFM